jgi:L-cysteine desulfidase
MGENTRVVFERLLSMPIWATIFRGRKAMSFTVKDILRVEVAPALGCTEPAAIALGAAAAASLLKSEEITAIEIWVDPNIYKNGIAVSIPGTGGLCGLDTAGALGAIGGAPELGLEVLEPVDEDNVAQAQEILKAGKVKVNLLPDQEGLFVKTVVRSRQDVAESVIKDSHDNIIYLTLNGQEISDSPLLSKRSGGKSKSELSDLEDWLKGLSLAELYGLIDDLDAGSLP